MPRLGMTYGSVSLMETQWPSGQLSVEPPDSLQHMKSKQCPLVGRQVESNASIYPPRAS